MSSVNRFVGRAVPRHRPRWTHRLGWAAFALGALIAAGGGLLMHTPSVGTPPAAQGPGAGLASDFWQRPGARSVGSENMQDMGAAAAHGAGTVAAIDAALQALARSQVVALDAGGHLRLTRALRNKLDDSLGWFDGPVSPEALEHARQRLRQELSGPAQVDALKVLDSYVAYRNAAAEQQARPSITSALPANLGVMGEALQLQRRSALRAQLLDTDLREAFFGDEEALDQYRLAIIQVQAMPSLSAAERDAQLHPLWQKLSPSLRAQIPAPGANPVTHN